MSNSEETEVQNRAMIASLEKRLNEKEKKLVLTEEKLSDLQEANLSAVSK